MKITYNENPLHTRVELDETEKLALWHKIKYEDLIENLLIEAHFCLKQGDIKRAKEAVDPKYYLADSDNEKTQLDKNVDELLEYYILALNSGHAGDCTCVPASCAKCHAESLLGIDTIKGLGKHLAHKINSAIEKEGTLEGAIAYLENYQPVKTSIWDKISYINFKSHIPRWKSEAADAAMWLRNYRDEHFPEDKRVD